MSDNPLQPIYMAQLRDILYTPTRAPLFSALPAANEEVPAFFRTLGHGAIGLGELLRDHNERDVETDWEVLYRDGADDLLSYYGCLEVAILTGFLSEDTVLAEVGDQAFGVLTRPQVRNYYERHYPLYLPRMFRDRLLGDPWMSAASLADDAGESFPTFMDLCSPLRENEDVRMFLWFLDNGYQDGQGLEDLLRLFKQPDELMARLGRSRDDKSFHPLDMAVGGFTRFIAFCSAFDEFLGQWDPGSLVASVYWSYHGYWFDKVGTRVRRHLDAAFDGLLTWQSGELADGEWDVAVERRAAEESVSAARAAVGRLTSRAFKEPLDRLLELRLSKRPSEQGTPSEDWAQGAEADGEIEGEY
jgi:hypothetical protein